MDIILPILLLQCSLLYFCYGVKNVPIQKMDALRGETIYLPCNVSTYEGDEVVLILWYREDKGTPIYSIDVRGAISKAAKRWSDDSVFGERAYFIFDKEPGKLSIQNTQDSDTGIYRCRVDFLKAQTRNSKVELTVIEPPKNVIIRDETGADRSTVVGPYSEGDIIYLECEVIGGKPMPQISWYRDGTEIIASKNTVSSVDFIRSELTLGPLGRKDLNSRLTCRATNHMRATPLEAVVQIDMNFAPLNIRLLGARQALSAGRRYDLLCQSAGSRPPAAITWWMNGIRLEKTTETTSSDGNQTTSTLSITLAKSDTGKYLSCRANNHAIPSEPLEDGWKLDIQYNPEAYVRLGPSLDSNSIREGTDVYFDCLVLAHPNVYRIEWRHNELPLPHNISHGVIISNHSLVLQGVTKATAGNYSCVGYNAEGEGKSAPFKLNILYTPICALNQSRIYGVAKQEDAKIKCSVDANPPEVDFSWTFNNSAESIDVATNHITRTGTSSTVTYTPVTELDYGTLLCIATNKIGRQRVPCVFHIIAAGRPDQVHNCTLTNISMTSLTVTCSEGFNGGLPQLFIMELKDINSDEIKANITSTVARFTVSSLSPGNLYLISIFAFNSKGRSDPTTINAAMLRMPEKQLTSEHVENSRSNYIFSPVISLSIGLTLTVLVAGLAVILALRIPCKNSRDHRKEISTDNFSRDGSPGPSVKSSGSKDIDDNESDEKNPDVVPESIDDSDDQENSLRIRQHISTIDTRYSPSRALPASSSQPPNFNSSVLVPRTSHNIKYCTLRNMMQPSPCVGSLTGSDSPHIYSNSIVQCTLPRHTSQQMWPMYNSGMPEIRHLQPLSSLHQLTLQHSTKPNIQLHSEIPHHTELSASAITGSSTCTNNLHLNRNINVQHLNQNQKGKSFIGITNNSISTENNCLSDDEVTVQTPLMVKRESTV